MRSLHSAWPPGRIRKIREMVLAWCLATRRKGLGAICRAFGRGCLRYVAARGQGLGAGFGAFKRGSLRDVAAGGLGLGATLGAFGRGLGLGAARGLGLGTGSEHSGKCTLRIIRERVLA